MDDPERKNHPVNCYAIDTTEGLDAFARLAAEVESRYWMDQVTLLRHRASFEPPIDGQVFVYMRNISLEVVVLEQHVWEFMNRFGQVFAMDDSHMGRVRREIDSFRYHPNGWHIRVTIGESEECRFLEFLREFNRSSSPTPKK